MLHLQRFVCLLAFILLPILHHWAKHHSSLCLAKLKLKSVHEESPQPPVSSRFSKSKVSDWLESVLVARFGWLKTGPGGTLPGLLLAEDWALRRSSCAISSFAVGFRTATTRRRLSLYERRGLEGLQEGAGTNQSSPTWFG